MRDVAFSFQRAARIDKATGVREVAEFYPVNGTAVFGFTHLPRAPARAGVVICSSLYAEFVRNYRREVLIGRRLASLGIAVQRFHYRGQGNSGGGDGETRFDGMVTDALAACERLRMLGGVERLAFLGTRFGALIAAAVASRDSGPVALWAPVLDPSRYFQDVFRARRVQGLAGGVRGSNGDDGMLDQLSRSGSVSILGYKITRALYESSQGRSLDVELGASPRRVFLLWMGRDPRTDRSLSELADRWRASGFEVEDHLTKQREPWWFTSGEAVSKESLTQASDETIDWFVRTLVDGGAAM